MSSLGIDTTPGIAAVPPKLFQKVTNKEYMDMCEFLPEIWRLENEA